MKPALDRWRGLNRQAVLAAPLLIALAACSHTTVGPDFIDRARALDPATFQCCHEPEKFYPPGIGQLALNLGDQFGPAFSELAYGAYDKAEYPGKLTGKPEAHAAILRHLQPLDMVLTTNHSYLVGKLMPGRFSHMVIYLGDEAQLRARGLWGLPELAPYHADIRAGRRFIEAATPDVHLEPAIRVFQVDQVLTVRPHLTPAERRFALKRLLATMGTPFNYKLGLDPSGETLVCTGLAHLAYPSLGFTTRRAYGEVMLFPDDIAAQAIRGEHLSVVTYFIGTPDGHARLSETNLMYNIAAFWGFGDQ